MRKYEFFKLLYFIFYKYCMQVDGWTEISNDFIISTNSVVNDFYEYRERVNGEMIGVFQKDSITNEFESIKKLKKEWLTFAQKFGEIESDFEDKYKNISQEGEKCFDKIEDLQLFLAEYSAYEKVASAYESLINMDGKFENFMKLCNFYRCQTQPS